jgi:phasin family protein
MQESGDRLARGVDAIGRELMGYAQQSIEAGIANGEALTGCRTPQAALELQTELARTQMNAALAEGSKLSKMAADVANQALAPLNARLGTAVKEVLTPGAA